jgi:hypothetical protein
MAYYVKINSSVFKISKTFADLLKKFYNIIPQEIQDKKHVFVLNERIISSFQVVKSTSQTHFYFLISEKKCRVNKKLFAFLNLHFTKKNVVTKEGHKKAVTPSLFLDKFYTKSSVAQQCVIAFNENVKVSEKDLIVEPSAGNGSFIQSLEEIKCSKAYIDVAPQDNRIVKADYLD